MAQAMADLSSGKVVQPTRVMLPVAEHQGFLGLMPGVRRRARRQAGRVLPEQPGHSVPPRDDPALPAGDGRAAGHDGRPAHHRDASRRRCRAVATRGSWRDRKPPCSAFSARVCRRKAISRRSAWLTFREVRVWSPRNAPAFAKKFGVRATASAEEAVRGADVVVVATSSPTPVLSGAWLAPGVHINAVGAPRPNLARARRRRGAESPALRRVA